MGVQVRVILYAPDEAAALGAVRAAFARIAALEDVMSDYRPTSELMRLCSKAGGPPVNVSSDLFRVLARAQELSRQSGGAFDVTVGPYVKLWRIARKAGKLPPPEPLAEARARVGWQKIRLDSAAQTVQLAVPGMLLDLGGIAKGYAALEMLRVLRRHGIASTFIEIGGDFVMGEAPPGTPGWRVLIENASEDWREATLAEVSVASSGDTMQFVEIDGVRYSHHVDPRTGMGITNRIAATIIAPNTVLTDGISTAVCVLGAEAGAAFLERYYPDLRAYVRRADQPEASAETAAP